MNGFKKPGITARQWSRRADRYIALMRAYQAQLAALEEAFDVAMEQGLASITDGYTEALEIHQSIKRTRMSMLQVRTRINAHLDRMLTVWDSDSKPS